MVQNVPRPREFDEDEVVSCALEQFWRRGFRATSTGDLERATGLNRSSLYNTFGGKGELFVAALDAYTEGPCAELHKPLVSQRGADALRGYLDGLTAFVRSRQARKGCLMVNSTLEEIDGEEVRKRVTAHFEALRRSLRRAIRQGLEDGTIEGVFKPSEGSDWLLAVVRGVLTGAAGGESAGALINALSVARRQLGL